MDWQTYINFGPKYVSPRGRDVGHQNLYRYIRRN